MSRRPAGWALLGLAATAIGMATLEPLPGQADQSAATPLWCVLCGEAGAADFLLNIALFVPLGAAAALLALAAGQATALAGATSLAVEALQFLAAAGRDPTLGDLVANMLGGWLGHQVVARGPVLPGPSPQQARRYLLAWAAMSAAVIGLTTRGLSPRLPPTPWFGQWAFYGAEAGWLRGTIENAWLGNRPLTHGPLQDSKTRWEALHDRPIRLAVSVRPDGPPDFPVRVIAVGNQAERFLTLGVTSRGVRFQAPMGARSLRLRTPAFLLEGVAPLEAGRRAELEGVLGRGWVRISRRGEAAKGGDGELRLGWWDGWMLLLPFDIPLGWPVAVGRLVWVIGLVGPMAWLGWRAARRPLPPGPERVVGCGEVG